jgi:hypothetical protein
MAEDGLFDMDLETLCGWLSEHGALVEFHRCKSGSPAVRVTVPGFERILAGEPQFNTAYVSSDHRGTAGALKEAVQELDGLISANKSECQEASRREGLPVVLRVWRNENE